MRRSGLAVAALLAVGLLPAAASSSIGGVRAAATASSGGIRVLRTAQPVERIAADGSRIAVATAAQKMNTCDRIVVWSPKKRTYVRFNPGSNCNTAPTIDDIQELALAGKTVYWLDADGGMWVSLQVLSRTLGTHKTKTVSSLGLYSLSAYESEDYGPFTFVGNLFGSGNLLVFNSWTACMEIPVGWPGATCPQSAPGDEPMMLYSKQRLLKAVHGAGVEIASAPDAQTGVSGIKTPDAVASIAAVVAVDAKRVAVQFPDGSVTIYSAGGAVVRSIPVPSGTFSGFALQGAQLVTIRNGKLELYNVSSGKLVKAISVPGGSQLDGLQKGLAVYVARRVHVLRLSDRKDVTFSLPRANLVDAQIEASGLFYAYNNPSGHSPGRVVFVPFARVLKKLR